jgi:prolipoprotein diacylglyceryltransferase
VPIAAIAFDFDPLLRLADEFAVRWQTLGLAAVLLGVLVVAGLGARAAGLRPEDALAIAVGAVPGAVAGGRLTYALLRPEAFASGPGSLIDPSVGGLELVGGVAGGLLTAAYVASLLGAPVGAWARLAALPVLVLIGGGKLAMALGGSGQGLPSDLPWATSYLGPGPWGSLAPDLPSHPSQLYEGLAVLAVAVVLAMVGAGLTRRPVVGRTVADGRILLVGLAAWSVIRAALSTTWRDPVWVGPLPRAGWVAVVFALLCVAAIAVLTARRHRAPDPARGSGGAPDPSWPDPAIRPPF